MNSKYYSYSSSYLYKNNNVNIEEEQISLNNAHKSYPIKLNWN